MQNTHEKDILFPLKEDVEVDYRVWESGDYPLHYHDDYEREIVTVGSGSQIMNGNTFELKEKDVFLLKPLDYHKIHSDKIGFAHIRVREELLPKWIVKG